MDDANHSNFSKTVARARQQRNQDQSKKCTAKITTANFARPDKQTRFSATVLASTKSVLSQKWRNTKLATTTARSQMKRSWSFILMAIPQHHLASSAASSQQLEHGRGKFSLFCAA